MNVKLAAVALVLGVGAAHADDTSCKICDDVALATMYRRAPNRPCKARCTGSGKTGHHEQAPSPVNPR
jgi:hypothetical protein